MRTDPLARLKAISWLTLFAIWASASLAAIILTDSDTGMDITIVGAVIAGAVALGIGVLK